MFEGDFYSKRSNIRQDSRRWITVFDDSDAKRCKEGGKSFFSRSQPKSDKKNHRGILLFRNVFSVASLFYLFCGKFPLGIVQIKRKWEMVFLSFFLFLSNFRGNEIKKRKFSCSWDVLRWDCASKRNRFWGDGNRNCNFSRLYAFHISRRDGKRGNDA